MCPFLSASQHSNSPGCSVTHALRTTHHQKLVLWLFSQVFLKGRAKRHADITDGRGKKTKPVADFHMEGNRTVTYGKIEHVVGHLLQLSFQGVHNTCIQAYM